MQYSQSGIALTRRFEGCKYVAYWDARGNVWTIGYGHTRGVTAGMTCTLDEAYAWLVEDTAIAVADVNEHVDAIALTQGEFDALVDFAFNLGDDALNKSTLLRLVNAGDFAAAAAEFEKWDHAGGVVVAGLLRRRQAEAAEFTHGIVIDPEISV